MRAPLAVYVLALIAGCGSPPPEEVVETTEPTAMAFTLTGVYAGEGDAFDFEQGLVVDASDPDADAMLVFDHGGRGPRLNLEMLGATTCDVNELLDTLEQVVDSTEACLERNTAYAGVFYDLGGEFMPVSYDIQGFHVTTAEGNTYALFLEASEMDGEYVEDWGTELEATGTTRWQAIEMP